jgi:hypothetical protein
MNKANMLLMMMMIKKKKKCAVGEVSKISKIRIISK